MIIRVRNKKIIYSIIGVVLLIGGFILFKSFAFFDSKYDFNVIKGRVPDFAGGDIQLAFTIEGVKGDVFPNKDGMYLAKSVTCQNGVTAKWNNIEWSLVIVNSNGNKKINCNVDFGKSLYKYVQIGDYVSYTPSSTSYTIPSNLTGYSSNQTINPSELSLWRVVNKNTDGTIEVISEYVSDMNVYVCGTTGYNGHYTWLDGLAKQYETSGITSGSKYIGDSDKSLVTTAIGNLKAQTKAQKGTTTYSEYFFRSIDYGSAGDCGGYVCWTGWWVGCVNSDGVNSASCKWLRKKETKGGDWSWCGDSKVRPSVILKDIIVLNGNGSESSPYKIN